MQHMMSHHRNEKNNPLQNKGLFLEVRGIEPPSEWATYELLQVYPGTLVLSGAWAVRPTVAAAVQKSVILTS